MSAGLYGPLLQYLTSVLLSAAGQNQGMENTSANATPQRRHSQKTLTMELDAWTNESNALTNIIAPTAVATSIGTVALVASTCLLWRCRKRCSSGFPRDCLVRCSTGVIAIEALLALCMLISTSTFGYFSGHQLISLGDSRNESSVRLAMAEGVSSTEAVLASSLRHANATLAVIFADAAPQLRGLIGEFAGRLAAGLSEDTHLTPLLNSLDEFVATVNRLVQAMAAVAASRSGTTEDLVALKTLVDDIRTRTMPAVEALCHGGEFVECAGGDDDLGSQLSLLTVLPSASRLDADASVTAVTLLDRVFRLNVTELGQRVEQAKSAIAGALGSADGPVEELLARLSSKTSGSIQYCLDAVAGFGANASAAIFGPRADTAVGAIQISTVVALTVVCILVAALIAFSVTLHCYREKRRKGLGRPSRVSVASAACSFFTIACCFAALLAAGTATRALSHTAEAEGCSPLATAEGRQALDAQLDELLRVAAWPTLQRLVQNGVGGSGPLPFRLGPEPPQGILESLLTGCDPNRTVALALNLDLNKLVSADGLLDSDQVVGHLAGIKTVIKKQLLGGAAASMIPSDEVASVLARLSQFAAVMDPVDYSSSIAELSQPLFGLAAADLQRLPVRLSRLGWRALARNATDSRGFRLVLEADRLRSLVSERLPQLAAGLERLREQFETLQNHRFLSRLTAELAARLNDFLTGLASLSADGIDRRFDQSFNATRPSGERLLESLLRRLLAGVGRCDGFPQLLGRFSGLCQRVVTSISQWGIALLTVTVSAACCCLAAAALQVSTTGSLIPAEALSTADNEAAREALVAKPEDSSQSQQSVV